VPGKGKQALQREPGKREIETMWNLSSSTEGRNSDRVAPDAFDELVAALFEQGGKEDTEWFEQNFGRNYRVRLASKGELLYLGKPASGIGCTAIRQVEPGHRVRCFFATIKEPPPDCFEQQAERCWRRVTPLSPDMLAALDDYAARRS
jgi:hypothetical protein